MLPPPEKDQEIISAFVEKPNRIGQFYVNFNRYIVLPEDMSQWTSQNEGADRLSIKLDLSEETEELLHDLELNINLSWIVIDKDYRQVQFGRRRDLQQTTTADLEAEEQAENPMIEVNRIRVQMNFTLPELVSQGLQDKDRIVVEMLPQIFTEELEFRPGSIIKSTAEDYTFVQELPKQTSKELDEVLSMLLDFIRVMMFGFITSNIFLGFFFSQLVQLLWGAINTLQMIVLTVLFNLAMPVNAYTILIEIMKITNLDVIDTGEFLDMVISVTETPSFGFKFLEGGYDTTSYFIELGPLFFVIIGAFIYVVLKLLIMCLLRKKQPTNWFIRRVQRRENYRSAIVRFLIEGCVELSLISMMCLLSLGPVNWDRWQDRFSTVCAILTLIALFFAPIKLGHEAIKFV